MVDRMAVQSSLAERVLARSEQRSLRRAHIIFSLAERVLARSEQRSLRRAHIIFDELPEGEKRANHGHQ
jgi:hypothetical protein